MTQIATAVADAGPHNNPCAQCGQPISSPVWSEPSNHAVSYVWICQACDYEFIQIAMYRCDQVELAPSIAA